MIARVFLVCLMLSLTMLTSSSARSTRATTWRLIKKGTRGDKAVYDKALYASSTEELENTRSQYLAKGAANMAKTPNDQLYLFASGP
jgi:hypothetical protein